MDQATIVRLLLTGQFTALSALALPDRSARIPSRFRRLLGWALIIAGGALSAAGAMSLGPDLRPSPVPAPGTRLRTTGPYAISRHPIYTGLIAAAMGRALASGGRRHRVAAACLTGLLYVKVGYEERLLGDVVDYAPYAAAVPRWGARRR